MFSNGTEYEIFLENNCYKCRRYFSYDDSFTQTDDSEAPDCCAIEEMISAARFHDDIFPEVAIKGSSCLMFIEGEHPFYAKSKNTISDIWKFSKKEVQDAGSERP
jgi:hypothetical protein